MNNEMIEILSDFENSINYLKYLFMGINFENNKLKKIFIEMFKIILQVIDIHKVFLGQIISSFFISKIFQNILLNKDEIETFFVEKLNNYNHLCTSSHFSKLSLIVVL